MNKRKKKQVEEMAKDICSFCLKEKGETDCSKDKTSYCFNKRLEEATYAFDLGYHKINEYEIIVSKNGYETLLGAYESLAHKYDKIADELRLCKDANETIKQDKQKLLKEMYEQGKFDAIADLEKEGKVVISKEEYGKIWRNGWNEGYSEIIVDTIKRTVIDVLNCLKELYSTPYSCFYENILKVAKKYGVDL